MKTKHWINASIVCAIPALFSVMLLAVIALEWVVAGTGTLANLFLTGEFNRPFTMWLFGSGAISISTILATLLMISRHTSRMDDLDQAISEMQEEKRKYQIATRKIVEQIPLG